MKSLITSCLLHKRTAIALAAALPLLSSIALGGTWLVRRPQQQLYGMPPKSLSGPLSGGPIVRASGLVGHSSWRLSQKLVTFEWNWQEPTTGKAQYSYQAEAVSFWPTAVVGIGENRVAVAGRSRFATILEIWDFGAFSYPAPVFPIGGGPPAIEPLRVPIARKTQVLSTTESGKNMVSLLLWNPVVADGYTNSFLLQFDDSKQLFAANLTPQLDLELDLVASPTATSDPTVFVQPALDGRFPNFGFTADNQTFGIVHNLRKAIGGTSIVVVIDSDRDGAIDLVRALSDSEWASEGWGQASSYSTFYGY